MRMETQRLILRDYEEQDREDYFKLKSDARTMYYLQDIRLFTREEAAADFDRVLRDMQSADRKFWFWHIICRESLEQIGSVGYTVVDDTPAGKLVGAGYFIIRSFGIRAMSRRHLAGCWHLPSLRTAFTVLRPDACPRTEARSGSCRNAA